MCMYVCEHVKIQTEMRWIVMVPGASGMMRIRLAVLAAYGILMSLLRHPCVARGNFNLHFKKKKKVRRPNYGDVYPV